MALTGHFIDNNWNLVKKVLNFCRLDGHRGIDIGKGVENCLNEWGFTNILSILVDNASSNDNAIGFMKLIFEKNNDCLLSGEWLHIRCAAHLVNLIVQDGLKHVGRSIESIRCAVKWIKKSGTKIEKFNKCAQSARCESTKSLVMDCPTRWNFTYNVLEVAHEYKDAFARTKYVTSHTLVNELAIIHALLRAQLDCDIHGVAPMDKHLYDIATAMKLKFENIMVRFPILSLMARDLLAIPISTVASESVFSTSGRVLDSFQTSLGDKTIECLVCAQDWLPISLNLEKNEDMDTIAKIENELIEQERGRLND
ncbi:zinc finger BED domain-containing protein RICESLEEPER 2-like protein [Tanacetum coccineum]